MLVAQQAREPDHLAQRLLQVVAGDGGELIELGVVAVEGGVLVVELLVQRPHGLVGLVELLLQRIHIDAAGLAGAPAFHIDNILGLHRRVSPPEHHWRQHGENCPACHISI